MSVRAKRGEAGILKHVHTEALVAPDRRPVISETGWLYDNPTLTLTPSREFDQKAESSTVKRPLNE
jgi:hypothetical protein